MTLRELQEAIEDLIQEHGKDILKKDVFAVYDYRDITHTQALVAFSNVEIARPMETAYSASGLCINDDPDGGESDEKGVVVLK